MTDTPIVQNSDKLDFKTLLPVFLVVLIDLLGLTIIIPLLPLYATSFGADPALIGLLGATYPIMQFIGAPLLGRLSDRYGRKPILIISQIGTLIGFLMLGLAGSLPWLFLSRMIDGFSGANLSTAQAIIADTTTEKTRTQGLGLLGAAFGLGFIIGPVIALLTLSVSGNNYHVPGFVAAVFSLGSIIFNIVLLRETHRPNSVSASRRVPVGLGAMVAALRRPQIGMMLALIFAQQLAFGGIQQLLALFTLNRLGMNGSSNAALYIFVGVFVVAIQGYFIGRLSRALGDCRLIYLGLATLALGTLMIAVTPSQPAPWYSRATVQRELTATRQMPGETTLTQTLAIAVPADDTHNGWLGLGWLILAMIPASLGGGVLQPALNSLITRLAVREERGGLLGISACRGQITRPPQSTSSTSPSKSGDLPREKLGQMEWENRRE